MWAERDWPTLQTGQSFDGVRRPAGPLNRSGKLSLAMVMVAMVVMMRGRGKGRSSEYENQERSSN